MPFVYPPHFCVPGAKFCRGSHGHAFNVPTMNLNLTALSRRTMILTIQGAREEAEVIGAEPGWPAWHQQGPAVPTVADNQAVGRRRGGR